MDKQQSSEEILKKTLRALARHTNLSPGEMVQLRLTDLHLAGKAPNINFAPAGSDKTKKVELDLELHRALVGWLVARPDSVTDLLFPGDESDGLTADYVAAVIGPDAASPAPAAPPAEPDMPAADETIISSMRPGPPPLRPGPPPPGSMPEMGPPGKRPEAGFKPFPPPIAGPEAGPPPVAPGAPATGPEAEPAPFPPRPLGPRVPPKPVRKRDEEPSPSLVKQKPEPAEFVPPLATGSLQSPTEPVDPVSPATDAGETLAGAPLPEDAPVEETSVAEAAPVAPPPIPLKKEAPQPEAPKPPKRPRREATPAGRSATLPVALSGVLAAVIICVICAGIGAGVFVFTGDAGGELLASLGLGQTQPEEPLIALPADTATPVFTADSSAFESPVSPLETPTATATLPPTSTPTPLPVTDTPQPTPVLPTAPPPTDTPAPTPTATASATPTTAAVTEPDTPTPEPSPTSGLKYPAPVLLGPPDGTHYDGINEIILQWEPVDLAADEQYAVRLVYPLNGQITYGGANVKEPQWVVPLQLYQKIDPPDNRYEWFVVVERLNEDGSGTSISPESQRLSFVWR